MLATTTEPETSSVTAWAELTQQGQIRLM